ncbi:unnamed protein product [Gordionus sp. m RMFG-2023]|uniref:large ribosomal subunit protein uL24m-like n=1 Tax=Gordionus sp. m RMFG-2023 TaxID=3053472 RepID=UPI0030E5AA51
MVNLSRILFSNFKEWHNFPKAYVDKVIDGHFPSWSEDRGLQGRKRIKKPYFWYGEQRPWEEGWKVLNMKKKRMPPVIEKIAKWDVFRGDRVEILVGPDKGKQGIVNMIVKERNWVYVEGLNCEYIRVEDKSKGIKPMMIKREHPLRVLDEVALVDPADNLPTLISWKFDAKGESVRVSDRSSRIIPVPSLAHETRDYKTKATYLEQPKDTKAEDHQEITYVPKLKSFEEDIAETLKISDYKPFKNTPRFYY